MVAVHGVGAVSALFSLRP